MKKWILILPFVLLALMACTPAAEPESVEVVAATTPEPTDLPLAKVTSPPPTAVSSPTTLPTDIPPAESTTVPTDVPTSQPTESPTDEPAAETAVMAGRIDEGAFFLGAPNAPVTMIDYSDFL
jgi:hypothetical protein